MSELARPDQGVRGLRRREFCAAMLAAGTCAGAAPDRITIAYQSAAGYAWPLFIAQQGGYYAKYGLASNAVMAGYPGGMVMLLKEQAAMLLGGLQQVLPASVKDTSLVSVGALMNRSTFSLIASKDIAMVRDLRGKRIAVSQVGDAPYGYLISVLKNAGLSERDVDLIPVGAEPSLRAAALAGGRADATLLFAPNSFHMEDAGYHDLADLAAYDNIFTTISYWVRRTSQRSQPDVTERLIKAHAEAIRRFYEDKTFSVRVFLASNKGAVAADVARTYDQYSRLQLFERLPYILQAAVAATLDQQAGPARNQTTDFRGAIDNSIVDRLVKENFFVNLFGSGIKAEQDTKSRLAFR